MSLTTKNRRKEKALRLTTSARNMEMAREMARGVLERVDTSIMVNSIILDEVGKVGGWAVAKDSMEAVLWKTWNSFKAEEIWKVISAEEEVQDIILKRIKN